ncbi:MAG: transposase [Rubritalea sp.]|uniref:IS256 family transposase n=1 Tax=Rubritalea sp. TaxID=2109375 RepID=UPI00324289F1
MDEISLRSVLAQASEIEAVDLLQQTLRQSVRMALFDAMEQEVNGLCGGKYKPSESDYARSGSEMGSVYLEGDKEAIRRPRVRDSEGEVQLEVYQAASTQRNLFSEVVSYMEQGLSQRGAARAKPNGLSKSAASRMWQEKSLEQLDLLRNRSLKEQGFLALMIDGVRLANEVWIIVAMGIDRDGNKLMLDFEEGSSENSTAVGGLLDRLKDRGIDSREDQPLLVVRDGSKAIKKAVHKHWPNAIQQECLVHMQRHTRDKLRARDRADFDNYCTALRNAQGKKAGEEAFEDILDFLSERNAAASIALKERKLDLISLHLLNVPSTLNVTFLNTNSIENSFRNWREATGNVKRWSLKKDMVSRWSASGMLWAESGFNKIRHAKDLGALVAALSASVTSTSLRSEDSTPADTAQESSCPTSTK